MIPTPKASVAGVTSSSNCRVCNSESPLIPQMLSELAFNKEHDMMMQRQPVIMSPRISTTNLAHTTKSNDDSKKKNASSNPLSSLSGLFCFSFYDDPDMFYDAQENHYDECGRHVFTPEEQELLKNLRGGGAGNYYDENFVPAPNNMGSRGASRPISLQQQSSSNPSHPQSGRMPPPRPPPPPPLPRGSKQTLQRNQTSNISPMRAMSSSDQFLSSRQRPHQKPPQAPQNYHPPKYGGHMAPPPPKELPVRFLRAGKGDPVEGQRRYEATLQWRKENGIDTILLEPHPKFELIKKHYPHYYHLRGYNGEPVFFEQPPKTDLTALKAGGIDLKGLVRHYTMVTEFQWQFIERDDFARSITVLDLEGIRIRDFVGECVEYVKMCSTFTGQHYPERAGHVIVVNVPRWFSMIWSVVKPMIDEVTLKKISIVRGQQDVFDALVAKIPIENIPPEYGGKSMPLGQSPEEQALRDLMAHNNALACGDYRCGGRPRCRFCSGGPARRY